MNVCNMYINVYAYMYNRLKSLNDLRKSIIIREEATTRRSTPERPKTEKTSVNALMQAHNANSSFSYPSCPGGYDWHS